MTFGWRSRQGRPRPLATRGRTRSAMKPAPIILAPCSTSLNKWDFVLPRLLRITSTTNKGGMARCSNGSRLAIPGVRPALVPPELRLALNELKAFRHVIVHAYDLQLDPEKLALVLKYAAQVADSLPGATIRFLDLVALQEESE